MESSALLPTPSQTVGPYFGFSLPWPDGPLVVTSGHEGAFWIRGRLTDGHGHPVQDALLETWQADPAGAFAGPLDPGERGFRGFGRCPTDAHGRFGFLTVRPGPVPGPDGAMQAPHIDVAVFARGLLRHLLTRIYFPDDSANGEDPLLASLEDGRRSTLVAVPTDDGYRFDIRLQGEGETAFFDL